MAHFAQLNENNKVIQVVVIANKDTSDNAGIEKEEIGIAFCQSLFGEETKWVQTSYHGKTRKKFASVNNFYDAAKDAFIPEQPYASWTFNETEWDWKAPTSYPKDGKKYDWKEETLSWVEEVPLVVE
jgi:hypothetical protein